MLARGGRRGGGEAKKGLDGPVTARPVAKGSDDDEVCGVCVCVQVGCMSTWHDARPLESVLVAVIEAVVVEALVKWTGGRVGRSKPLLVVVDTPKANQQHNKDRIFWSSALPSRPPREELGKLTKDQKTWPPPIRTGIKWWKASWLQ